MPARNAATGEQCPLFGSAAEALEDLYQVANPTIHVHTYLDQLCEHAVRLIGDAAMAGVTVLDLDGSAATVARTSAEVAVIDELQYRSGAGPCIEAARSVRIVVADEFTATERWPQFAAAAATYGVESFLSIPVPPFEPGMRAGALNVYGICPDGFATSELALMKLFTIAAGYAISTTERYRGASGLARGLGQILDSRAVIDQAKGVLMAVHGVDADDAFGMLVEKSQRSNKKLRIVAEELLASVRITDA